MKLHARGKGKRDVRVQFLVVRVLQVCLGHLDERSVCVVGDCDEVSLALDGAEVDLSNDLDRV